MAKVSTVQNGRLEARQTSSYKVWCRGCEQTVAVSLTWREAMDYVHNCDEQERS